MNFVLPQLESKLYLENKYYFYIFCFLCDYSPMNVSQCKYIRCKKNVVGTINRYITISNKNNVGHEFAWVVDNFNKKSPHRITKFMTKI